MLPSPDGVSTSENTMYEAQLARDDGILIFTIGVGLSDTRELDGIASQPTDDHSFKVKTFAELKVVDDIIYATACPSELFVSFL